MCARESQLSRSIRWDHGLIRAAEPQGQAVKGQWNQKEMRWKSSGTAKKGGASPPSSAGAAQPAHRSNRPRSPPPPPPPPPPGPGPLQSRRRRHRRPEAVRWSTHPRCSPRPRSAPRETRHRRRRRPRSHSHSEGPAMCHESAHLPLSTLSLPLSSSCPPHGRNAACPLWREQFVVSPRRRQPRRAAGLQLNGAQSEVIRAI